MAKESYHQITMVFRVFTVLIVFIYLLFLHVIVCYECNDIYFGIDDFSLCPGNCAECLLHNSCLLCQTNASGSICKSLCKKGCVVVYLPNGTHLRDCNAEKLHNECCVSCPFYNFCSDCSQFNGTCLRCSSEFYDSKTHCDKKCGSCKPDKQGVVECDIDTGYCQGDCRDGFYGLRCDRKCNNNCLDPRTKTKRCDKHSGKCIFGCVAGLYNDTCENACTETCAGKSCDQNTGYCTEGCASGRYGVTCEENCSGTCAGNSCDQKTGHCVDGCVSGRYGDRCQARCSDRCAGKSCDQYKGYCTDGCDFGRYGDTCEMNCTSTCRNNICNQLSGLCGSGCLIGWHGAKCETSCKTSCLNLTCNQISGHCESGCIFGTHGNKCEKMCSSTCYNNTCDHLTGSCINGCVLGWFGDTCSEPCSSTCASRSCVQDSGLCEKGCVLGYYGDGCENNCSEAHVLKRCDNNTTLCTGCETAFVGDLRSKDSTSAQYSTYTLITCSLVGAVSAMICLLCILVIRRTVRKRRSNLELEIQTIHSNDTTEPIYDYIDDTNGSTSYTSINIQMEHCPPNSLRTSSNLGKSDDRLLKGASLIDTEPACSDMSATLRINDYNLNQDIASLPNRDSYETPISNTNIRYGSMVEMGTFEKHHKIADHGKQSTINIQCLHMKTISSSEIEGVEMVNIVEPYNDLSEHGDLSEHSNTNPADIFFFRDSVGYLNPVTYNNMPHIIQNDSVGYLHPVI